MFKKADFPLRYSLFFTIKILYLCLFLGFVYVQTQTLTNSSDLSNSSSQTIEDDFLDEFDDDIEDLEELKKKVQRQNKNNSNKPSILDDLKNEKPDRIEKNGGNKRKTTSKSIESNAVDFKKIIQNTFKFGTYDQQNQLTKGVASDCRKKALVDKLELSSSEEEIRAYQVIEALREENYFKNPFKKDGNLVLANLELIQNCRITEELKFIEKILLDERKYMDYPEETRIALKIKSWEIIADFFLYLKKENKANYVKLAEQYYRYDRYHNNDPHVKRAVLIAAGKLRPKGLNHSIKRDYKNITDIDLRNTMIETIGLYKDIKDIEFFHKIIKDPEGTQMHRWIAIISFTNYAPQKEALKKLKEYIKMPETEIKSRAYYVLGFYNMPLDFFIEASRSNDEFVRLQAVAALTQFSLSDIEDLLKYKSTQDSSEAVREKAKKVLEDKKSLKQ